MGSSRSLLVQETNLIKQFLQTQSRSVGMILSIYLCVCTFMGISSIHVKQTISYRIESMTSRSSKGPSDVTAGQSLFAFLFLVAVSALAWLLTFLSWQILGSLAS